MATVVKQGSELLEASLWSEVRSRKKSECLPLAKTARNLLETKAQAHELMADILAGKSPKDQFKYSLSEILRDPVKRIPIPGEEVLAITAHALRIIGIYLCTIAGDLDRCPCLADLMEAVGKEEMEETLTKGLGEWAEKASIPTKH
jgi:hypothetical protein